MPAIAQNADTSLVNIVVFDAPADSINDSYKNNKSFTIKTCQFSDDDGNAPPVVSAGVDQTVLADTTVTLNGIVSNSDGVITRQWWTVLDKTPVTETVTGASTNETQLTFLAPTAGEVRFMLTAVDDGCKLSRDTIVIKIKDEVGEIPGFQLSLVKIKIEENRSIDLIVTASDGANGATAINDISLVSRIEGVSFIKNSMQSRGNRLIWKNARPVGLTKIRFTANVGGEIKNSFILVDVVRRGQNNRGGGCSASKNANFDPLFLIYVFWSFIFLLKRRHYEV